MNSIRALLKYRRWADIPKFHRMVISTAATQGLLTVLGAACTVLISRKLGVEAKGIVSWMTSYAWASVLIIELGIGPPLVKYMAKNGGDGSVFIVLNILILAVSTAVAMPIIYMLAHTFPIAEKNQTLFAVSNVFVVILALTTIASNVCISTGQSTRLNLLSVVEKIINVSLYALLLLTDNVQPLTVIMVVTASLMVKSTGLWSHVKKHIHGMPSHAALWLAFIVTRKLMFAAYFNNLANGYTGMALTLVLGVLASSRELGYFVIAATFITFGQILPNAISTFTLPNLSREQNPQRKRHKKRLILFSTFAIMLVTALPLWLFPKLLVGLLFGPSFLPAAPCLQVMALGMMGSSLFGVCQSMIASHHKEWRLMISSAARVLMITAFIFLFQNSLNAITAAYIYSVTHVCGFLVTFIILLVNYFEKEPMHA